MNEKEKICPICHRPFSFSLKKHIHTEHSEEELTKAILVAKRQGIPDVQIGKLFQLSFKKLEKILTNALGANISPLSVQRKNKCWAPKDFREETTTVWSFKKRGDWATHNPRYRGNWSPYIPRNIILKYSNPGEIVLDYFVGGGTTAIEAKLLGRKCIARDINPTCVQITKENLRFSPPPTLFPYHIYEPEVSVGDARDLSDIPDESIDLICAHPPYAGIINYSSNIEGDLSNLGFPDFLKEMRKVASESFRVLKKGKKCALLLGDARKQRHIVPLGFEVINLFLQAGFMLKELVIKRQHNCKTTGFWYERSIKHNFLLLAHEYLPVFEKPFVDFSREEPTSYLLPTRVLKPSPRENKRDMESSTVWLFPKDELQERVNQNVFSRYGESGKLLFLQTYSLPEHFLDFVREQIKGFEIGSYLVIQTKDVRVDGYIKPLGKLIFDSLKQEERLWLKEIIIVAPEDIISSSEKGELEIIHQYLLVYEVKGR
ncbi:MAG: TRM11 family SAM-dependent methyltransferase [bacterium]